MHVSGTPAVLIGRDVSNEPLRSIRNIDIGAYRTLELILILDFTTKEDIGVRWFCLLVYMYAVKR